jgi:hypothetical protein
MFRMHSRRIGPGTLVVLAAISLAGLAVIAAFGLAGLGIVNPAYAQQGPVPSPVTLNGLFERVKGSGLRGPVVLKMTEQLKDALKKAHPDGCYPPRVTFTILAPKSFNLAGGPSVTTTGPDRATPPQKIDPGLFLRLQSPGAREEQAAIDAALTSMGLEPDQVQIRVAETPSASGKPGGHDVQVSYDRFNKDYEPDKEAPKLKVVWTPVDGTSVKAGDQIQVTITASERYEDGHKSWPSGVFGLQLRSDDGKVIAQKDFFGHDIVVCARRTLTATYIVPINPPPVVRLQAFARDAAENKDSVDAAFPTGPTCNFWVDDVKSEVTDNTRGSVAEPGTSVRKVTYHVRLREGPRATGGSANLIDGRQIYVFEIPLINEGTTVEGSEDEDQSGPGGHRTSGFGTAKLLNPGTRFGSVGYLLITNKGERVEYRFTLEPDFESRLFSTTIRPARGGSFDSKEGFLAVPVGEGSTDPQAHRRITGGGHLMEGDYTYGTNGVLGKTSWKLRTEIAPCKSP